MVMQPGQDWDGDNGTGALDRPTQGRILAQCQVHADLIVVRCISRKNLPQVRCTKDQHPVQAFAAHGANQALHIRILPWRSRRDRSVSDAHGPHPGLEDISVGTVIVAHQVGRCRCPRRSPDLGYNLCVAADPAPAEWRAQPTSLLGEFPPATNSFRQPP